MKKLIASIFISSITSCSGLADLHKDFVFIKDIDPTIIESPRYATEENFMGKIVPGYEKLTNIVLTKKAAQALKKANDTAKAQGYVIVVYDGYRPQKSVNSFIEWSKDFNDQTKKNEYYPYIDKKDAFKLGYIAERSGHTRGSTVDLTLIKKDENLKPIEKKEIEIKGFQGKTRKVLVLDDGTLYMGTSFDMFDEASHHNSPLIDQEATNNREKLRNIMESNGFESYEQEWWHYTLKNEPFPKEYFDETSPERQYFDFDFSSIK